MLQSCCNAQLSSNSTKFDISTVMWSFPWSLFESASFRYFLFITYRLCMQKEHFLASTTDELIPDNITFTETNRDLHANAAICSGSQPKGCNIELVRLKWCKFFLFSAVGHKIREIENNGCVCLGCTEVWTGAITTMQRLAIPWKKQVAVWQ